jgi:hypothetical protein
LWVLYVLSGRGLCDGLITRPEESYRPWRVLVCDLGTSKMRRLKLIKDCKCRIEEEFSNDQINPPIFNMFLGGHTPESSRIVFVTFHV